MKDWFNKLENNHKLLLIIGLYVATFLLAKIGQYAEFFSFLCVGCLIFAIIFTVYYSQYKKSKASQETQNPVETKSISNYTHPNVNEKKIETDVVFLKIDDGYYLRWHYKENVALSQNLDKVQLNDCDIELVPEPDNQYDANAVALYKGNHKLGYFYKGQTQEMILSYLDNKNYQIKTVVCLLDPENNKLAVKIAFYHKLDAIQLDTLTVSLIKIHKKAEEFGSSRYENVSLMNVGEYVEIFDNYDGGYTVCDECGNELGELNAKKIEDIFDDIIYAKIADIELTENDAYKVKISIFYR